MLDSGPTAEILAAGMPHVLRSPKDAGVLEMIVRRPGEGQREVVDEAELDVTLGLVGDNWATRGSRSMPDGSANPEMQLNVMNARVLGLLTPDRARWALAGDQLLVDFDLSVENLPLGSRLAVGAAVIEITAPPHTGCAKFSERFGAAATRYLNSPERKQLRLRGLNAKVITPGTIRAGDRVAKVHALFR